MENKTLTMQIDHNATDQILQALQSLKGDFSRIEQGTTDMRNSLESMQVSVQATREQMIEHLARYEAKAESIKSIESSVTALHRRLDDMAITVRDHSLWIEEKKDQQAKREERIASGFYSIGFDSVTKILAALVLLAYLGWQWQIQQEQPQPTTPIEPKNTP